MGDSLVEVGIRVEADKAEEDSRRAVVEGSLEEDNLVEEDSLVVVGNLVEDSLEAGIQVVEEVATS